VAVFIPHGVDMAVNDQNVFTLRQVEPVPAGFDGYVVDKHIFATCSQDGVVTSLAYVQVSDLDVLAKLQSDPFVSALYNWSNSIVAFAILPP